MEQILIGVIARAQGIKGEVKVNALTDDAARFSKLKQVYVGKLLYRVEWVKVLRNGVFIKFFGVDDRNTAETLKNLELTVERKEAIQPPDGRYYIVDIIGCEVTDGNTILGKIVDIANHGSADVYTIQGEKNFMFPCVDGILVNVDIANKKVTVDSKKLEEVAVYED